MKPICCKNFNIINIGDIGVSKPHTLSEKRLSIMLSYVLLFESHWFLTLWEKIVFAKHTESMKSISLKSSSFEHTCAHTIYRSILLANHVLLCMTMPNEIFEYFEELHSAVVAVKDQRDINVIWKVWIFAYNGDIERYWFRPTFLILKYLPYRSGKYAVTSKWIQWCLGMRIISNLTVMHQNYYYYFFIETYQKLSY